MTTDRLPPLLALARDWKAADDGPDWRDAAWCHALLGRGQHEAVVAWIRAAVRQRTGASALASLPPSAGFETEAIAVALLRRLRAAG